MNIDQNSNINQNITYLLDAWNSSHEQNDSNFLLNALVECLHYLYDEESMYYDEETILEKLIGRCYNLVIESNNTSKSQDDMERVKCLVNLVCIGYKANIVNNQKIIKLHEFLNKVSFYRL